MSLKPMNRESMLGLKAKKDEEMRLEKIKIRVKYIYTQAVYHAENFKSTFYNYHIDQWHNPNADNLFYMNNMEEILRDLQNLFPDCRVKYTKMFEGSDGKMYDILENDSNILPLISPQHIYESIVIDWS